MRMCWTFEPLDGVYDSAFAACTNLITCKHCDTCTDHCECVDDIDRDHYCDGGGDA